MKFPEFIDAHNPILWATLIIILIGIVLYIIKVYQFQPMKLNNKRKLDAYLQKTNQLSREIELSVEREKGRISKELHDSICHELLLIKMQLQQTKDKKELISDDVILLTNETLQKSRDLAYQFRPIEFENSSLEELISNVCNMISENSGLQYEFNHSKDLNNLPLTLKMNIFRICQEATKNIIRHSKATEFSIELYNTDGYITLIISDNGIGFEIDKLPDGRINSDGLGLIGIQERVSSFNGIFNIDSIKGKGSNLIIEIPWKGD